MCPSTFVDDGRGSRCRKVAHCCCPWLELLQSSFPSSAFYRDANLGPIAHSAFVFSDVAGPAAACHCRIHY